MAVDDDGGDDDDDDDDDELFCAIAGWQKALSLIFSWVHCLKSSSSQFSNMPLVPFEPMPNLSSGLIEQSCAVVITTTLRQHEMLFGQGLRILKVWFKQ